MELTKIQRLLLYGLDQFDVTEDNAIIIMMVLEEEDEQLLMIDYLMRHPKATEQDILNTFGDILKQRNKINRLKKDINETLTIIEENTKNNNHDDPHTRLSKENELTELQSTLVVVFKKIGLDNDNIIEMILGLEHPDDQFDMGEYMVNNPKPTPQEIINKFNTMNLRGDTFKQKKKINELKKGIYESYKNQTETT